jgi:hypothetical protein
MPKVRIYRGCIIEKLYPSGLWTAITPRGRVRADTLEGLRALIREYVR